MDRLDHTGNQGRNARAQRLGRGKAERLEAGIEALVRLVTVEDQDVSVARPIEQ